MAFATSPSAFGIKSAKSGGAFGSPSTYALNPSPGPFSTFASTSSSQPQQSTLFGGSTQGQNQNQPQTQPSIFGQPPSGQQPQQPSTGFSVSTQPAQGGFGTWGQTNTQQNQQQQQSPSTGIGTGGSIFGNPSGQQQNQQQPLTGIGTGSSIFGNPTNQQQNQQQPTTGFGIGSSIFGNASNQEQNQQTSTGFATGGNIFGSSISHQQSQQHPSSGFGTGGSVFGNTGGQQQNQQPSAGFSSGSIFGNTGSQQQQQKAPQLAGGLWGSNNVQHLGQSTLGQSSFGLSTTSQQQPLTPFTRTTKFNDLSEQIQKTLESIDTYIQGRIQISSDLKARSLDEEPTKGAELIREVHNDLVNTLSALQADKVIADELRSKVDQSVQDTIITTRIIDGFRNPQQHGAYLKNYANFPIEFFGRAADEIRQKLHWYKTTIEQIERRLASAQGAAQYNPHAITATLQAQNSTFIALAAKTAELDDELQKIKSVYRELWRAQTGSAKDPFNEVDRRPGSGNGLLSGISSLNLSR